MHHVFAAVDTMAQDTGRDMSTAGHSCLGCGRGRKKNIKAFLRAIKTEHAGTQKCGLASLANLACSSKGVKSIIVGKKARGLWEALTRPALLAMPYPEKGSKEGHSFKVLGNLAFEMSEPFVLRDWGPRLPDLLTIFLAGDEWDKALGDPPRRRILKFLVSVFHRDMYGGQGTSGLKFATADHPLFMAMRKLLPAMIREVRSEPKRRLHASFLRLLGAAVVAGCSWVLETEESRYFLYETLAFSSLVGELCDCMFLLLQLMVRDGSDGVVGAVGAVLGGRDVPAFVQAVEKGRQMTYLVSTSVQVLLCLCQRQRNAGLSLTGNGAAGGVRFFLDGHRPAPVLLALRRLWGSPSGLRSPDNLQCLIGLDLLLPQHPFAVSLTDSPRGGGQDGDTVEGEEVPPSVPPSSHQGYTCLSDTRLRDPRFMAWARELRSEAKAGHEALQQLWARKSDAICRSWLAKTLRERRASLEATLKRLAHTLKTAHRDVASLETFNWPRLAFLQQRRWRVVLDVAAVFAGHPQPLAAMTHLTAFHSFDFAAQAHSPAGRNILARVEVFDPRHGSSLRSFMMNQGMKNNPEVSEACREAYVFVLETLELWVLQRFLSSLLAAEPMASRGMPFSSGGGVAKWLALSDDDNVAIDPRKNDKLKGACIHCGKATDRQCGGCLEALVCSQECLKGVWKIHKTRCKKARKQRAAAALGSEKS